MRIGFQASTTKYDIHAASPTTGRLHALAPTAIPLPSPQSSCVCFFPAGHEANDIARAAARKLTDLVLALLEIIALSSDNLSYSEHRISLAVLLTNSSAMPTMAAKTHVNLTSMMMKQAFVSVSSCLNGADSALRLSRFLTKQLISSFRSPMTCGDMAVAQHQT